MGGRHSLPLSTSVLREVMRSVAERVLGTEWSAFDYGMHSLRIGRANGLRAAERDANASVQQAQYTQAATTLRSNMLRHLVNDTDGSWYCEQVAPPAVSGCAT